MSCADEDQCATNNANEIWITPRLSTDSIRDHNGIFEALAKPNSGIYNRELPIISISLLSEKTPYIPSGNMQRLH